MDEDKESYYSLSEVVNSLKAFRRYLLKKWLPFLLAVILGGSIGFAYYHFQKPKYEAVTTFILEDKSSSSAGLSGLASQFGFNVGSLGSGGGIFSGDNILNILKSKRIVQKVLLSTIDSNKSSTTLADYYLEFSGLKESWTKDPVLKNVKFAAETSGLSPLEDSILNNIYDRLTKKAIATERLAKQGTVIRVQVAGSNQLFARLMSERLVEEASKLYFDIRTGSARADIQQLQRRSDSLLMLLNRKSFAMAESQPLDINPGIKTAAVPVEIASRDKTVLTTLFAEVTKNLEASKVILSQQSPVIQLLDKPSLLLDDNKKSLSFLLIAFSVGAAVIYTVFAFMAFFFFKGKVS